MNTKLLLETIERMGVVSYTDLQGQMGAAQGTLAQPLIALLHSREIGYSHFLRGEESFHSRAFLFCLRTVSAGAALSAPAQALYGWLGENPGKTQDEMFEQVREGPPGDAFRELSRAARILPIAAGPLTPPGKTARFDELAALRWATDGRWLEGLHRPARCGDPEYCLSLLRGQLLPYCSTREIQSFLYGDAAHRPPWP